MKHLHTFFLTDLLDSEIPISADSSLPRIFTFRNVYADAPDSPESKSDGNADAQMSEPDDEENTADAHTPTGSPVGGGAHADAHTASILSPTNDAHMRMNDEKGEAALSELLYDVSIPDYTFDPPQAPEFKSVEADRASFYEAAKYASHVYRTNWHWRYVTPGADEVLPSIDYLDEKIQDVEDKKTESLLAIFLDFFTNGEFDIEKPFIVDQLMLDLKAKPAGSLDMQRSYTDRLHFRFSSKSNPGSYDTLFLDTAEILHSLSDNVDRLEFNNRPDEEYSQEMFMSDISNLQARIEKIAYQVRNNSSGAIADSFLPTLTRIEEKEEQVRASVNFEQSVEEAEETTFAVNAFAKSNGLNFRGEHAKVWFSMQAANLRDRASVLAEKLKSGVSSFRYVKWFFEKSKAYLDDDGNYRPILQRYRAILEEKDYETSMFAGNMEEDLKTLYQYNPGDAREVVLHQLKFLMRQQKKQSESLRLLKMVMDEKHPDVLSKQLMFNNYVKNLEKEAHTMTRLIGMHDVEDIDLNPDLNTYALMQNASREIEIDHHMKEVVHAKQQYVIRKVLPRLGAAALAATSLYYLTQGKNLVYSGRNGGPAYYRAPTVNDFDTFEYSNELAFHVANYSGIDFFNDSIDPVLAEETEAKISADIGTQLESEEGSSRQLTLGFVDMYSELEARVAHYSAFERAQIKRAVINDRNEALAIQKLGTGMKATAKVLDGLIGTYAPILTGVGSVLFTGASSVTGVGAALAAGTAIGAAIVPALNATGTFIENAPVGAFLDDLLRRHRKNGISDAEALAIVDDPENQKLIHKLLFKVDDVFRTGRVKTSVPLRESMTTLSQRYVLSDEVTRLMIFTEKMEAAFDRYANDSLAGTLPNGYPRIPEVSEHAVTHYVRGLVTGFGHDDDYGYVRFLQSLPFPKKFRDLVNSYYPFKYDMLKGVQDGWLTKASRNSKQVIRHLKLKTGMGLAPEVASVIVNMFTTNEGAAVLLKAVDIAFGQNQNINQYVVESLHTVANSKNPQAQAVAIKSTISHVQVLHDGMISKIVRDFSTRGRTATYLGATIHYPRAGDRPVAYNPSTEDTQLEQKIETLVWGDPTLEK